MIQPDISFLGIVEDRRLPANLVYLDSTVCLVNAGNVNPDKGYTIAHIMQDLFEILDGKVLWVDSWNVPCKAWD